MLAKVLVAALVLALLSDVVTNLLRPGRAMAQIAARPDGRIWFYRRFLFGGWTLAVFALLPVVDSPVLTLADLGLTWSGGGVAASLPSFGPALAWALTAFLLAVVVITGNRLRRHAQAGGTVPTRDKAAPMFPRTPRERGLAAAVAVTAGITEEIVFRGLLTAAGVILFDLPLVVACALSIALFAATHLYQGAQGVVGVAALAVAFTGLTVLSGTLLPAIALHVVVDLIAFLHIPPPPLPATPAEAHPAKARPAEARPAEARPARAQTAEAQPPTDQRRAALPQTQPPRIPAGARPASARVQAGALSRAELAAALANSQPTEARPAAALAHSQPTEAQPAAALAHSQPTEAQPAAAQPEYPPPSSAGERPAPESNQVIEGRPAILGAPSGDQATVEQPASTGTVSGDLKTEAQPASSGTASGGQVTAAAEPARTGAASGGGASAWNVPRAGAGAGNVPVVPGRAPVAPAVPKLRRPAPGA
ncbi:type II CAAX prenyl endopeptidase Rce1 family protein [Actinoplanes sp. NPDC048988]|uniref:CPBP family glutamic-type intramembrane protease n=1 Tax=Actinoplanes sp. NPDC048988 TaxID=3363901 RepID=UPI0037153C97